MYSYLSRAEAVYRQKQNDSKACGNISYLLWGGLAALGWSKNKLRELGELDENEIVIPNSSYPGESSTRVSSSLEEVSDEDYVLPIEPKVYGEEEVDVRKILFPTKEMAEEVAEMIGCKGSHAHETDQGTYYMPCETHPE